MNVCASNDNEAFLIEGPDENGELWLVWPHRPVETVIGLGNAALAREIMLQWIEAADPAARSAAT